MSNDNAQNTPDHRPAVGGPVERMVRPGAEARWYCLSRDGMATLCTDEEDAKEVAAESWVEWPQNGPYRVARMVDADTAESLRTALTELRDRNKVQEAIIERAMPLLRQIDADDPCDYGMEQQPMVYSVSKLLADIDGREWPPMQTANA